MQRRAYKISASWTFAGLPLIGMLLQSTTRRGTYAARCGRWVVPSPRGKNGDICSSRHVIDPSIGWRCCSWFEIKRHGMQLRYFSPRSEKFTSTMHGSTLNVCRACCSSKLQEMDEKYKVSDLLPSLLRYR
jgi:hypothetical protein